MRHTFSISLLLALLLGVFPIHTAYATTPLEERNESIRENNQEFRSNVREAKETATKPGELRGVVKELNNDRMASNSGVRQTYRSERAKLHGERIERRFAWYAQRLTNIATRLQARLDKQKADGKDVTKAQSILDTAKTTLTQAVADGKKAVELFQSISVTTWDTQKTEVKTAIDQAQKARKGFIEVRKLLLDAVKELL